MLYATYSWIEWKQNSAALECITCDCDSVNYSLIELDLGGRKFSKYLLNTLIVTWQLSESMKDSQADLYLETYQVLDIEIGRLREIQRWQSSAAFKVRFFVQCSWHESLLIHDE